MLKMKTHFNFNLQYADVYLILPGKSYSGKTQASGSVCVVCVCVCVRACTAHTSSGLLESEVPGNIELNTARTIVRLLKGWLISGLKTGTQRRTRIK